MTRPLGCLWFYSFHGDRSRPVADASARPRSHPARSSSRALALVAQIGLCRPRNGAGFSACSGCPRGQLRRSGTSHAHNEKNVWYYADLGIELSSWGLQYLRKHENKVEASEIRDVRGAEGDRRNVPSFF